MIVEGGETDGGIGVYKKKNSDAKCQLIKKKETSRAEKRDSEMHFSLAQGKNDNIWRQTAEIETLQATKPRLRAPNRLRRVNYLGRSVIHSDTGFLLITDRTGTSPDACSFLHLLCLFFSLPITFSFAFPKKLPCMQVHPDQRCQLRVITLLLLWVFFFLTPSSLWVCIYRWPSRQKEEFLSKHQQRVSHWQQETTQCISKR